MQRGEGVIQVKVDRLTEHEITHSNSGSTLKTMSDYRLSIYNSVADVVDAFSDLIAVISLLCTTSTTSATFHEYS